MDSPGEAAEVLRELRDFGVKVYLDDFGAGYSSLSHLHNLPIDALKIDRSFVRSLLLPNRPAIVESILALARTLNTSVVAEGIESDVQAHELDRLGCTTPRASCSRVRCRRGRPRSSSWPTSRSARSRGRLPSAMPDRLVSFQTVSRIHP
jgi:predicted signal transduction protein with EAL and GGDEF domain